jgi:hypothetical protein
MTRKQLRRVALVSLGAATLAVATAAAADQRVPANNTGTTNFVVRPNAVQPGNGDVSLDFSGVGTYSGTLRGTFTTKGTQTVYRDRTTDVKATASITGHVGNCALANFPLSYTLAGRVNADRSASYGGFGSGTNSHGAALQIWLAGVQPAKGSGTFEYRVKVHCGARGSSLNEQRYSVFPPLRP